MTEERVRYAPLMRDVVGFSLSHVQAGGIPFAAYVVDARGRVLGRGVNRVRQHHDPTAHAEVEAIRQACRNHQVSVLHGATLLASGEPCALCYLSALYAGVSHILFAVDRDEVAAHGFDYRNTYRLFQQDPLLWSALRIRKLAVVEGLDPFRAFQQTLP
ncbi:MAG: nucleoside deaminase [Neisseriaceae bacterium]|nr:nucleoside deaminase [Neisseriaceae bacterium]